MTALHYLYEIAATLTIDRQEMNREHEIMNHMHSADDN